MIRRHQIEIAMAGADGSAAGTGKSAAPIFGELKSVHLDYTTQPATCDTVLKLLTPDLTLLTVTDNGTDRWAHPRLLLQDNTGANLTAIYGCYTLCGYVQLTGAQGNAGSITATLLVEE